MEETSGETSQRRKLLYSVENHQLPLSKSQFRAKSTSRLLSSTQTKQDGNDFVHLVTRVEALECLGCPSWAVSRRVPVSRRLCSAGSRGEVAEAAVIAVTAVERSGQCVGSWLVGSVGVGGWLTSAGVAESLMTWATSQVDGERWGSSGGVGMEVPFVPVPVPVRVLVHGGLNNCSQGNMEPLVGPDAEDYTETVLAQDGAEGQTGTAGETQMSRRRWPGWEKSRAAHISTETLVLRAVIEKGRMPAKVESSAGSPWMARKTPDRTRGAS